MPKRINSTLVFRGRKTGLHIDTKARIIQIAPKDKHLRYNVYTRRLVEEHGFIVQLVINYTVDRRIYISGAISGFDIEERRKAFKEVEDLLRKNGYHPINPFNNGIPEDAHWKKHMRADIKMLTECEGIYFMNGWTKSKGCKLEFDIATSMDDVEIINLPRE